MKCARHFALWIALGLVAACAAAPGSRVPAASGAPAGNPVPPVAAKRPHTVRAPAGDRIDEYYWLRDDTRSSPEMLAYLKAENAYKDALLAPLAGSREQLFKEIVARIPQEDVSAPILENGYEYSTRFVRGGEYPVHVRRRAQPGAAEEVLLDGNALARGHDYFGIGAYAVSGDGRRLAWAEDTVGRREYVIRFKDLETGAIHADVITRAASALVWAGDHQTLLYIEKDPVTLLGRRVRRHLLGSDPANDPIVYEESDPSFYIWIAKSRSQRYLKLHLAATDTTEQRIARADDPALEFRVLLPREQGHEYSAEDVGDRFVLRTNDRAPNFRLVEVAQGRVADRAAWRELVPHPSAGFIEDFSAFREFVAFVARVDGFARLHVRRFADATIEQVAMPEAVYTVALSGNRTFDTSKIRFEYTSLKTPDSVYEYDAASRQVMLRKRDWVGEHYDPARYETEYLHAPARDGTLVPVSIVYLKDRPKDGRGALCLTAYGAYGISNDPSFDSARLSLLERGVGFALAHVRGGQELGRSWYDRGRKLEKRNTFTDFIDATEFLAARGYASRERIAARGGSAGGLLMGAIANMAPEKYRAIAAHVPFVDVVTTMLDESIPLTTNEFDEWGNPKHKEYYDYMLSYSPYDNVRAQAYPALFVSAGLWDSQVQYYEPAKWVARLRARKTDARPLVLHMNMDAGHGGKSGRFTAQRETADEYAFLLEQLGVPVRAPAR